MGVMQGNVRIGDRLLKRIQVHDHQIDGWMPCLAACASWSGFPRRIQQPTVHFRVQRLDAPIQYFGKSRVNWLISTTGIPASFSERAVPPVETISIPSARNSFAKSTSPVLSETLIRRPVESWP